MPVADRIILCMKWGNAYAPDYVNVLFNACRSAMQGDFRFVCLTDDGAGLDDGIEVFSIPEIGLSAAQWKVGGCWPKVGLFDTGFHGLRGRCLFIDLDMVILRDLDSFFDMDSPFVGIDAGPDWGRETKPHGPELGTGIISFDIAAHPQILESFGRDVDAALANHRTEQVFVAAHMPQVDYWPDGWVISFKRSLRQPLGMDLLRPPREAPQDAKIIAFHGTPRPIDLIQGNPYFWDRFPHMGHGKVGWMVDYWQRHGGGVV